MKKLYYAGAIGLVLFEIANVYFIMPMPGSQELPSLGLAYFLYRWRWVFRGILAALAAIGFWKAWQASKKWALLVAVAMLAAVWMTNFEMAADTMFYQPGNLQMKTAAENKVPKDKLVIGVAQNGAARAYPIQFIGYHHQVLDTLGGEALMVTYCTVCRTGRVYRPVANGQPETFRLVGMDHFNAMFEDARTKSWWRQVTGEAVAGPLTGQALPEVLSEQLSLEKWLALYPHSRIMQPDSTFSEEYKDMDSYDIGKGRGPLTGTDTLSWQRKSWVVGIAIGTASKAFDWNRLLEERLIQETVGQTPIVLALAADNKSFVAFERPSAAANFTLQRDTLHLEQQQFTLRGDAVGAGTALKKVQAVQEFWHSWQTFHPHTEKYYGARNLLRK